LEEDVDLSPEREQAAVTIRTILVKYGGSCHHKKTMHDATKF